jgi:CheY-like chemotaxis protein
LNWKSSRSPQKIELVVLDLNLPKKDGFEVLKMIKADASLRDLPVVIFTSSEADSDVKRACDLKADGYILKGPGFKDFKDGFLQALDYWLSKDRLKNDLVDLR